MALKMFFYPIQKGGTVDVRIWDWSKMKDGVTQLPRDELKTVCVEEKPMTASGCVDARTNFYNLTVDDPAIFSCGETCPNRLKRGDLLLLVAMHVASKQTPEWLWATYWWRPADSETHGDFWTCDDAQRTNSIGTPTRPWANYSMDVTQSFRMAKPKPSESNKPGACGLPGKIGRDEQYLAAYNPFVEASFSNGLKSSCIDCHSRASTSSAPVFRFVPEPDSVDSHPALRDFEAHVRLDYIWSLWRSLKHTDWPPQD
jgi:hypothetical protein